jgi:hypothetical protein
MNQHYSIGKASAALDSDLLERIGAIHPIPGAEAPVFIFPWLKLSASVRAVLTAFLALFLGLFIVSANAQTNSAWNGGTGNWSNSRNWHPAAAPNNTGTTTYDVTIGVANSNVTMDVLNDSIDDLTLDATTSLTISGNTLNLILGASSDAGMITNSGGVVNNKLGSSLTISSGFLNQGAFISGNFVAGSLNNTGKLLVSSSGLILNQDGDTINNSGTLINAGNLFMLEGVINNTGILTNNSDNFTILDAGLENYGKFYNYGMIHNEGGINNNLDSSLTNYGTINTLFDGEIVNYGRLLNTSGGTINEISFGNLINHGTLINAGTINNSDSQLYNFGVLNNSGILLSTAEENIDGLLDNYGTLNNSGTLTNSSGTPFGPPPQSGTLNNYGTINNSGMLFNTLEVGAGPFAVSAFNNFGTLNNSGTITNTGTFTNSGLVKITSSGLFTTSTNYTQTAGRTIVNGTLTPTGPAIVDIQGGILSGGGTINGSVKMAGTMIAGMPGTPLTFLINGSYEQTGTGIYDELIGSNANGLLQVSGAAKLDPGASLDIFLLGGFDPSNGTSFTILDYGSESGAFAITDPFFNGGTQKWVISSYSGGDGDDIILTAEANNVETTPEPANTLLLGTMLLVAAWYARKKRSEQS